MTYELSQVVNLRDQRVAVPEWMEINAVVAEITQGWDLSAVQATLESGVSEADREAIREVIETYSLSCSPGDCEDQLIEWCRSRLTG